MKQPTSMREAGSMLKERWLDRRIEKLSRQNEQLRTELDDLRHDLDTEQDRTKETLSALSKARKPGRLKWIVLAGGAYVLGTKAGRARYEQMKGWVRSMTSREDGERSIATGTGATSSGGSTTTATTGTTTGTTGTTSGTRTA
jgi:cell division septum initiation protein DivIVA